MPSPLGPLGRDSASGCGAVGALLAQMGWPPGPAPIFSIKKRGFGVSPSGVWGGSPIREAIETGHHPDGRGQAFFVYLSYDFKVKVNF